MSSSRILVVEDDESLRRITQVQLEKLGYTVAVAVDVPEALDILASGPREIVITDLNLPGLSGMDLLTEVRLLYPETTVVIITAYGTIETAVEALKAGAYDYLTKPVHPAELRALVSRVMEQHRLHDEVRALKAFLNENAFSAPARERQFSGAVVRRTAVFEWVSSWPDQCCTVTHDLNNQLTAGMDSLGFLLRENTTDSHLHAYAASLIEKWPIYRESALTLANAYESHMTPARLLDLGPLSGLPDGIKQWLRPVVHESWMARFNIGEHIASVSKDFGAAEPAFALLSILLRKEWPWPEADRALGRRMLDVLFRTHTSILQTLTYLRDLPILSSSATDTAIH